jgi:uncharacterized protein (DUF1697 family)
MAEARRCRCWVRAVTSFVALLRGINVGGNNVIRMPDLAECLTDAGYGNVLTYMQSGNVLFSTDAGQQDLDDAIQRVLEDRFGAAIPVVTRSRDELAETIAKAPPDHGSAALRSEVIFVKRPLTAEAAYAALPGLREGVDTVALGPGVIYFSRVATRASKTRLTKLMVMPMFQQMTMRTWRTTTRLLALLENPKPTLRDNDPSSVRSSKTNVAAVDAGSSLNGSESRGEAMRQSMNEEPPENAEPLATAHR